LLLAIANAVDIAWTVRMPPGGALVRASHHAFDAAETLGLGVFCGALLGTAGHALRRHRKLARLAYLAAGVALAHEVLGPDLLHQAEFHASGAPGKALFALWVVLCGAAFPVAHAVGRWCGRRRIFRWIALVAAIGGVVTSHLIVRDDYAPLHAAIEWTSAALAFGSVERALSRWRRRALRPAGRRVAVAGLVLAGLAGLAVPPPNRTRVELFQSPGAIGAWALACTVWSLPSPPVRAPAAAAAPRLPDGPVPPSAPPLLTSAPVVVMITVDATRADVVFDPANAQVLPFFQELGRTGVTFARAIAPGSQTSVSLTTMFSGRYFSQLYWARFGRGPSRFLYAAEDPAPRFPEILARAGVQTALFGGTNFLANEYGVARGFATSKVPEGRRHAWAGEVLDPLIARLQRTGPEPTFLYAHIMEPHAPYDRGKKTGTDFERYVSEVSVADAAIARVARALAERFPARGVLIVSADHGEAFGEHATFQHTKTIYDELLHVPLFVRAPGLAPRRIDERVTLADIGPTVLDLFGLPAPPGVAGQSLVPLLRGQPAAMTRPVLAEGRLRRAIYVGSVKVIEDERRKLIEAYDLDRDPKELNDLFDDDDPRAAAALAELRAFFDAYELRRPGYSAPYKP
jgi:arylsulfatase A-like enzyme